MPGDMAVALGRTTVNGGTLFAHNSAQPQGQFSTLELAGGRDFAAGETVQVQWLRLPQVRHVNTVLGRRRADSWGYEHGINEHGVAVGRTSHRSKLHCTGPALTGPDLVRLSLERAQTALQAVDLLTDLIERHGQGRFPDSPAGADDSALLVCDPTTAFLLEAAGHHWVCQEIQQVRAISDASQIRQDWNRISRGLASRAIEGNWWPADGSKLDFTAALAETPKSQDSADHRWTRATALLEQQSGHIDGPFLRRLLSDHYETLPIEVDPFGSRTGPAPLCQHGFVKERGQNAGSLLTAPSADPARLVPAWCAFGPPCITVYFPVYLEGDLPTAFTDGVSQQVRRLNEQLRHDRRALPALSENLARMQARFDQQADEFSIEGAALKQQGELSDLRRQATHFMQHTLEQFQSLMQSVLDAEPRRTSAPV